MKSNAQQLQLAADLCDRLGIPGYIPVSAETLPLPEPQQTAQGFAPAPAHRDLQALVSLATFNPMPMGLPELKRAGWELSRALDTPSVVVLERADDCPVQCLTEQVSAIYQCDPKTWAVDFARIPDWVVFAPQQAEPGTPPLPMVALWQQPGAPITAVVLAQRLAESIVDAKPLPEELLPAQQSDPWLHSVVKAQLLLADPLEVCMAAARCWRWADPPCDPRPYIDWTHSLGKAYARRIQSLAAARARLAEEGLDGLLEYAESEDGAWCAAVDSIALERDGLQGVRTLLLKLLDPTDVLELQEALDDLDVVGASLPAVFAAWPAADPEAARRAWLAEPDAWWTAHEHERANVGWEEE